MIDPHAVAIRGLSYGALLVALRGLFGVEDTAPAGNRQTPQYFIFTRIDESQVRSSGNESWITN